MWSKITVISVILMLAAGVFAYQNYEAQQKEEAVRQVKSRDLADTNAAIADEIAQTKKLEAETADLQQKSSELEQENSRLESANAALTADIASKTSELDEMNKKLSDLEEKLKGMADVAELAAQIEKVEQENLRLTEALEASTARRDNLIARSELLEKNIESVNKLEGEQRARISPAALHTNIRSVYNDWGFVIIGGGADQGIVLGSKLAVYRDGEKLAELMVNNVEAGKSSADIIPSTKAPNVALQAGDVVKSIRPATTEN